MTRIIDETFTRALTKADPKGFENVAVLTAAVGLTVPVGAHFAIIQCETVDVRWIDDGTIPTALIGMLLKAGTEMIYTGNLENIQFIETVISASLNVSYYG